MTGCCYGKVCALPWAIEFPKDHISHPHSVHPTQIYESGLNLALYLSLAFFYRRKRFEGQVFAVYLMSYAILRAFVEMFRGDYADQNFTGLLTPGQQVSIGIFVAGAALYIIRSRTKLPPQPATTV
jgi:phosphatidylglycerol:prolipoprotein diacylglycerol transferase